MIPTRRFYLLLLLGMALALLLANLVSIGFSLKAALLFDLGLIVIAFRDGMEVKSHLVAVNRNPPGKLSIGRDNPVVLTVKSGDRAAQLRIKDDYPPEFAVSTPIFELKIEPDRQQDLIYTIKPNQRGEYQWSYIQVRQLSQWGLVWCDRKIDAPHRVLVYPDLLGLKSLTLRLAIASSGTIRQTRLLGQGTEFRELREYRTGDDTRLIDWKATARRTRPVVRVLEPEREQTIIILLDRGRLMTSQVQGISRFDWGLNASLSLALAGLHRGDKVGIAVFDRQVSTWMPPQRGQHQLSSLIERLAPIQPILLEADYVGAVTQVLTHQPRRALVVVITDIVDAIASAELLAALRKLQPSYLPFCVTLREPQIDDIAHHRADNLTAAYQRAVALDLLEQRKLAFSKLKQKGVLVLDAPASQISEELVDRYIRLKARNLL